MPDSVFNLLNLRLPYILNLCEDCRKRRLIVPFNP